MLSWGGINWQKKIEFMEKLLKGPCRKIYMILDGLKAHFIAEVIRTNEAVQKSAVNAAERKSYK